MKIEFKLTQRADCQSPTHILSNFLSHTLIDIIAYSQHIKLILP